MARQIRGCVRNCIPTTTGDNALGKDDVGMLVSLTADGSYAFGEPGVQKTPIADNPITYGVHLGWDEGAERSSVSTDGLVIVKKESNAVADDVGKRITTSTTKAGHAAIAAAGGFGLVVAIESTDSPNLLVDLSAPVTDTAATA